MYDISMDYKDENGTKEKELTNTFSYKLYSIFDDEENYDCCGWNDEGTIIKIHDEDIFTSRVLPNYFKHTQLSSFVRQLNMYDFHKIGQETVNKSFQHVFFLRGRKDLLVHVKRKRNDQLKGGIGASSSASASSSGSAYPKGVSSTIGNNNPTGTGSTTFKKVNLKASGGASSGSNQTLHHTSNLTKHGRVKDQDQGQGQGSSKRQAVGNGSGGGGGDSQYPYSHPHGGILIKNGNPSMASMTIPMKQVGQVAGGAVPMPIIQDIHSLHTQLREMWYKLSFTQTQLPSIVMENNDLRTALDTMNNAMGGITDLVESLKKELDDTSASRSLSKSKEEEEEEEEGGGGGEEALVVGASTEQKLFNAKLSKVKALTSSVSTVLAAANQRKLMYAEQLRIGSNSSNNSSSSDKHDQKLMSAPLRLGSGSGSGSSSSYVSKYGVPGGQLGRMHSLDSFELDVDDSTLSINPDINPDSFFERRQGSILAMSTAGQPMFTSVTTSMAKEIPPSATAAATTTGGKMNSSPITGRAPSSGHYGSHEGRSQSDDNIGAALLSLSSIDSLVPSDLLQGIASREGSGISLSSINGLGLSSVNTDSLLGSSTWDVDTSDNTNSDPIGAEQTRQTMLERIGAQGGTLPQAKR